MKTSFNKAAAVARIQGAGRKALEITGGQAIKDTDMHVPRDQNTLRDSGITNSGMEGDVYIMRWDTPYAQYLYHGEVMHGNPTKRTYGPEKIKFTQALAREEWAKYAHDVYGSDWKQVYENALKRELKS